MNSRCKIACLLTFPLLGATQLSLLAPLGSTAYSRTNGLLFTGALETSTGAAAVQSIAVTGRFDTQFSGITGQTAFINGQEQNNPLYGSQISLLSTMGRGGFDGMPTAVIGSDSSHVYVVSQYKSPIATVLVSPALLDGASNVVSGIEALAGSGQSVFFAAVAPQGGSFGDPYSGIVTGVLTTSTSNQDMLALQQINLVDRTYSLLATGTSLSVLDNPQLYASYYFAQRQGEQIYVGTLYAGFHAISGNDSSATVRAVISSASPVGIGPLNLQQIVPATALGADSIIGATGALTEVTIHQLTTLMPSVGTQYLVVVGGVGTQNEDPINVYALPVTASGQLASINAPPLSIYGGPFLVDRQFDVPAQNPDDIYTSTAVAAIVGAGPAPGPITNVFTSGDSVCISVINDDSGQASGIFYSQALFNTNSVVCGWTPWERALYPATSSSFVVFDNTINEFWYGSGAPDNEQRVVRTNWQLGATQLATIVSQQLPQSQGGIQGITDIPVTSNLISTQTCSFALLTGNKTVLFAQTAQTVSDQLTPQIGWSAVVCSDGTLNALTTPTPCISCSGGALNQVGPIITAAVAVGATNLIIVGGNGGLAVLAQQDGSGIPIASLEAGFANLSPTLFWQPLGNYSNVRKIITVDNAVYVLTDTLLDQFIISQNVVAGIEPLSPTRLATAGTLINGPYSFFSDLVISEPFAILATSSGLLRVGNGSSIAAALSQSDVHWTPVTMPESTGVATRLLPLTITGDSTDLFSSISPGNIYVLSADPGNDQARVYRYVVTYGSGVITDTTIQIFNDMFVQNQPTFLVDFGTYRNFFYTDGMLWSSSRSRFRTHELFERALPATFKIGFNPKLPETNFFTASSNAVGAIQRLSGLGAWVIPGDFGLVVHQ